MEENIHTTHLAFVKYLGAGPAILLGFLITFHKKLLVNKGYVWDEGWFFCSTEDVNLELATTHSSQSRLVRLLIKSNCVEWKRKGLPAQRVFKINVSAINKLIIKYEEEKAVLKEKAAKRKELWKAKGRPHQLKTMPYQHYLQTKEWKELRNKMYLLAGFKCSECGVGKARLNVHHLTYTRRGCEDIRDLVVLCESCHGKVHSK